MKVRSLLKFAIFTSSHALLQSERLKFEEHPRDQTVIVGEYVKLSCKANLSNVEYEVKKIKIRLTDYLV